MQSRIFNPITFREHIIRNMHSIHANTFTKKFAFKCKNFFRDIIDYSTYMNIDNIFIISVNIRTLVKTKPKKNKMFF